jgi:hypothetical protein
MLLTPHMLVGHRQVGQGFGNFAHPDISIEIDF